MSFSSRAVSIPAWLLVGLLASGTAARAQDAAPPAHVAAVDGNATLERERGSQPAVAGLPLIAGDRLRTTGGRVEVLFPDGSALDVDEYTTLDLASETLLRIPQGRVRLTVAGAGDPAGAVRYLIDTPVATARTEGPGEYRLALMNGESELAVIRGSASLITERGSIVVRAGQRSLARDDQAPGFPQRFNSARADAFDRWADALRDARPGSIESAQYLPRDLQAYGGTFDRSGSWQYDASYGDVWYPAVAAGWRPYFNGYWAPVGPYGWTWIGLDAWAWPTHHYGRWGVARDRWFWIPDRQWSAAWVSWASAPGYVGWCPLGADNRPVFALSVRTGVPEAGWVVLPRDHFSAGLLVGQHAMSPRSLPARTSFVGQPMAPAAPSRTVPRSMRPEAPGITAPRPIVAAPAAASAIFRRPMAEPQPRTDSSGITRPAGASAGVAVPGARPSQPRQGAQGSQGSPEDPRAWRPLRSPGNTPRPDTIERDVPRPGTPEGARPSAERPRPPRQPAPLSAAEPGPSLPAGRSGSPAPVEPSGRAATRSAPAQAAAPAQQSEPAERSAPPAGARAPHRR